MTPQAKKVKEEMIRQFLWWAKYNPTVVKEKFGITSMSTLEEIIRFNIVKK